MHHPRLQRVAPRARKGLLADVVINGDCASGPSVTAVQDQTAHRLWWSNWLRYCVLGRYISLMDSETSWILKQVTPHPNFKELAIRQKTKPYLSVDSMLNWSDHEGEDVENGAAQVYGMIAGV
ncbi:hypothetical protein Tco_0243350 [Tanacetum coccineum]